ncbi:MAG: hypothetical protein WD556_04875 [Actinomycetota bacterium]
MPRRNRRDRSSDAPPQRSVRRSDPPSWALASGEDVRQVVGDKPYRCPGCDHQIRVGLWHLVVVPAADADARRHWHTECWRSELRRTGTL